MHDQGRTVVLAGQLVDMVAVDQQQVPCPQAAGLPQDLDGGSSLQDKDQLHCGMPVLMDVCDLGELHLEGNAWREIKEKICIIRIVHLE